jgi:LCP family protein required for cell wall assembly
MGDCSILYLNRDTMVQMPVLGLGGKEAGSVRAQLALAHTYGNGLEESCENTRRTVSDFLNGISIDYYISMRMDAIAMLNDAVGGVTVLVEDDFSQVDSSIPKGLVTLRGEQALNFVRSRKDLGDQLKAAGIDPGSLFRILPFLITLIVLAFTSKNSRAPKAEGIPYDKGSR